MARPGANEQVSIVLQKTLYDLEHLRTPMVGKIPWPRDPPSLHEEGHKGQKLQPERLSDPHLISDARVLDSALQSGPAMPSPRNLRLLVFSVFCPQLLTQIPPVWQFQKYNATLCLPSRRKNIPSGANQKPLKLWG